MANPAVVQIKTANFNGGTAPTATFTGLPIAGNAVIVLVGARNTGSATMTALVDNQTGSPNTYVKIKALNGTSGFSDLELWWCPSVVVNLGTFTVTGTLSTSSDWNISLMEGSGILGIDQSNIVAAVAATSDTINNAGANSHANDLVVAGILLTTFNATAAGLNNPPNTGYTTWAFADPDAGDTSFGYGYKTGVPIETDSASWTWTTSLAYIGVIASFYGAAATGGGPSGVWGGSEGLIGGGAAQRLVGGASGQGLWDGVEGLR